jgi:hypothetical protein
LQRGWQHFERAFGRQIAVKDNSVYVLTRDKDKGPTRLESLDGRRLRWLGTSGDIGFLATRNSSADEQTGRYFLPAEIRRLDLVFLAWLPSWEFEAPSTVSHPAGGTDGESRCIAVHGDLVAQGTDVFVLTYLVIEKASHQLKDFGVEDESMNASAGQDDAAGSVCYEPLGYRVTRFDARAVKPIWSKSFDWIGDALPRSAETARSLGRVTRRMERLTWIADVSGDEAILVCAGSKQDLMCLSAKDGQEHWRKARLWEYERGFLGPSVFEYFVDRFGIDYSIVSLAEDRLGVGGANEEEKRRATRLLTRTRKRFDRDQEGWLAAGPIVVPGEGDEHIFIAAARRRRNSEGPGHEAPPECRVYELEADTGEAIATTTVPRMVAGGPFEVLPNTLIWSCDRGSLVRLHCYETDFRRGFFGPTAGSLNDALCRVAWYREYPPRAPHCWISVDPPRDVAAFGRDRLFRAGSAYVLRQDDKTYHLRIDVVDLKTGLEDYLTLEIPFHGDVVRPGNQHVAVDDSVHLEQPHLLRIAALKLKDTVLQVILERSAEDREAVALEFELNDP